MPFSREESFLIAASTLHLSPSRLETLDRLMRSSSLRWDQLLQEAGVDYFPLCFVHDEVQLSVKPDQADMAASICKFAMKDVEHLVKFRCALDSEAKTGSTWADCH